MIAIASGIGSGIGIGIVIGIVRGTETAIEMIEAAEIVIGNAIGKETGTETTETNVTVTGKEVGREAGKEMIEAVKEGMTVTFAPKVIMTEDDLMPLRAQNVIATGLFLLKTQLRSLVKKLLLKSLKRKLTGRRSHS
jgi:hypothetical protein